MNKQVQFIGVWLDGNQVLLGNEGKIEEMLIKDNMIYIYDYRGKTEALYSESHYTRTFTDEGFAVRRDKNDVAIYRYL